MKLKIKMEMPDGLDKRPWREPAATVPQPITELFQSRIPPGCKYSL